MQPEDKKDFFDATQTTCDSPDPETSISAEIADAKIRADHQNLMAATMVDDFVSRKKSAFRRTVVLSVGSVVVLLILAIVFFVYLHWYGAGAGVALLAFATAQVWLHHFKKWDKINPDFDDILLSETATEAQAVDTENKATTPPLEQAQQKNPDADARD